MIRDITLGQYYASDSLIHRLDPRVKIIATLLFIIELFIVDNFIGFAICAAVLAIVIAVSKVPLSFIMRGLKPVLFILFFTFALNPDWVRSMNVAATESSGSAFAFRYRNSVDGDFCICSSCTNGISFSFF